MKAYVDLTTTSVLRGISVLVLVVCSIDLRNEFFEIRLIDLQYVGVE
jgi:hypothetical protein